MKKLILLPLVVLSLIVLPSYSQVKKLLRKAELATSRMEFEQALVYYDQALQQDPNSYRGNVGKGMVLAEFLERYDQAIPYLEKALSESPKDTLQRINYSLGKSYQYVNNYPEALHYYGKLTNYYEPGDPDFAIMLKRRIANCKYALAHTKVAPSTEQSVTNVGFPVNSDMPEYGAVIIGKDLIFTSKRKDGPNEKRNGWDNKYFESMYKSTIVDGKFTEPERYTLPDRLGNPKYLKHNEAVISASADGKKLFIYRDAKIYETDIDDPSQEATPMDKNINIARFQSHACLSPDGKELYFTSAAKKGVGGTDIYVSTKDVAGNWSPPEMLDTTINTFFDEDAPFISSDGTLYFSSNGLPGYGGFDIYKSHKVDGHWTRPENLGLPINSSGDDIFFTLNNNSSYGYYSSARFGGQGDMDIYQVHYVSPEMPDCKPTNEPLMTINVIQNESNNLKYRITSLLPNEDAKNVRSYSWEINETPIDQTTSQFEHVFDKPGNYNISAKAVVYCDSCPTLLAFCSDKTVKIGEELFSNNDLINNNQQLRDENLKIEQQEKLNWKPSIVYFDFDKYTLQQDGLAVLDYNITELKKHSDITITINGYADSRGSIEYNKALTAKRANFVKEYYIKNGIDKNRIKGTYAFGKTMLVNNCFDGVECTEEQHQMNRRVECKLINKESKDKPFLSLSQK